MKIYKQVVSKEAVEIDSAYMLYAVTESNDYSDNEIVVATFNRENHAKIFAATMNSNFDKRDKDVWYDVRQLAQ